MAIPLTADAVVVPLSVPPTPPVIEAVTVAVELVTVLLETS